ncbi:helix-turn-helix transcriptional regulator [Trebonia sp.]|uniref:helix-turn-helix domain-containing protein n=1 Tax=Trebonia sp. TaxID=2767075 RepID=UPI002605FED6|nr:helix-turn-helix transcriptional regulator [Trebonia sp.]
METGVPDVKTTSLAAFASQLRLWRLQMSWTQVEVGGKLGYSASLISGVETMDKAPTADFAARCDEVFSTPATFATLQELVAREAYPAFFAPVIPFEREAVRIHGWELGPVPGLLQTEDYARALLEAGRPMDSRDEIDRLVAARMKRQEIITGQTAPLVWYVLDESVLRHVVGGPAVMGRQLDRLLDAADTPGIVVQALPFAADNHAGADGPIAVYEFAESPSVCYTECYGGGRIVEGREEVADLMTVINLIRASALSARHSRDLIRRVRTEIDG